MVAPPLLRCCAAALALSCLLGQAAAQVGRPAACNVTASCDGCADYWVEADFSADAVPPNVCGEDGTYFPVALNLTANCRSTFPFRWLCRACCAAGCGGSCAWQGQPGTDGPPGGCQACPDGLVLTPAVVAVEVCRSCYRSTNCTAGTNLYYGAPGRVLLCLAPLSVCCTANKTLE